MTNCTQADSKQKDVTTRDALLNLISVPPADIKSKVRERVIGQDEAVGDIVDQLYLMIQNRLDLISGEDPTLLPRLSSFCLVGSTASGKSYTVGEVASEMGIPVIMVDCTTLTGTGWRGRDLNKELERVYNHQQANPGTFCLLFFDEADKMRLRKNEDEPSFCPQGSFLTLLEAKGFYNLYPEGETNAQLKRIDMNYVLPVFAGAFTGIEKYIAERLAEANRGFIPTTSSYYTNSDGARLRSMVTTNDLVSYGMLSELCGRIGQVINMEALDRASLKKIICDGDYCLQERFSRLMPFYCSFVIDECAASHILDETEKSQLGVRGLENTLVSSAAKARTLAWEDPGTRRIILSYHEEERGFILIKEISDGHPKSTEKKQATR